MATMRYQQPGGAPVIECAMDPKVCNAICPNTHNLTEFLNLDNVGYGAVFNHVRDG